MKVIVAWLCSFFALTKEEVPPIRTLIISVNPTHEGEAQLELCIQKFDALKESMALNAPELLDEVDTLLMQLAGSMHEIENAKKRYRELFTSVYEKGVTN